MSLDEEEDDFGWKEDVFGWRGGCLWRIDFVPGSGLPLSSRLLEGKQHLVPHIPAVMIFQLQACSNGASGSWTEASESNVKINLGSFTCTYFRYLVTAVGN